MNTKLKGYKLLNGDIISPEVVYAEFNTELSYATRVQINATINAGHMMLMLYKETRDNLHIVNVYSMLQKMEGIFAEWDHNIYTARRWPEGR